MGTGAQHKPKYIEYDPKQVQAVKDKFAFFASERMRQRGLDDITYDYIDELVYLDPSLISNILNCNPLKLRQPKTRKEHLRKIILALVMNQAIVSQVEANEFLQLIYPGEQLRAEYALDKEISNYSGELESR